MKHSKISAMRILLATFVGTLIASSFAVAFQTTPGGNASMTEYGAAKTAAEDVSDAHPRGQLRCNESARGASGTSPTGAAMSLDNCSTFSMVPADFCTATPTAGGCPMAPDGGTTIAPGWIPFPNVIGVNGIYYIVPSGTATATTTSTNLGSITGIGSTSTGSGPTGIGMCTIAGQILTMPSGYNRCRVSVAEPTMVVGVTATGFSDGDSIMVDFSDPTPTNTVQLANMADVSGTPTAAPLQLPSKGGVGQDIKTSRPSSIHLWLNGGVFACDGQTVL